MDDEYFPNQYNHEEIIDQTIMPLLLTILNVCDEYEIPMVASFQYCVEGERAKLCTSMVIPPDRTNVQISEAAKILTTAIE